MNQFYSALVISAKKFPRTDRVFKPRYNKEFFKRLTGRLDQLESHIEQRCGAQSSVYRDVDLKQFKEDSVKYLSVQRKFDQAMKEKVDENDLRPLEILEELDPIEDRLMPVATKLPNRSSKTVPPADEIVDNIDSDFLKRQNLSKVLSHTKLSYINNCYSKSVVGPNSHYYFGIGAKLQYGLSDFFAHELEKLDFAPTSGMCLTKSAVVEAANSPDLKSYMTDPCRILTNASDYISSHLVEASREAILAFVSTLGHINSNDPLKLMMSGTGYRSGSEWFDPDDKRVAQFVTLHSMIVCPSIEAYSSKEYLKFRDDIWSIYKKLGIPARLVHCSFNSLFSNEFDAHRVEIWLPSRQQWIPSGRVSHYHDYLSVRTGIKRGHILDSTVYDGQAIVAAIIENFQTSTGKFMIPDSIAGHIMHLTDEEQSNYFRSANFSGITGDKAMLNYESRRYINRDKRRYGHAANATANRTFMNQHISILFLITLFSSLFVDWPEFWRRCLPRPIQKFSYDYIYRPWRRLYTGIAYYGFEPEDDYSFEELEPRLLEDNLDRRKRTFDTLMPGRMRDVKPEPEIRKIE